jgi:hypothetical protein
MHTLLEHAREYARGRGIEIAVIEGPALLSYQTARIGADTVIALTSGTAHSADCGYVVYFACEAIEAARALEVKVRPVTSGFGQRLAS